MNGIPSIKVKCKCGHEWLIALPPWESPWSTWTKGGYSNCSKCGKLPDSFIWAGMQAFGS